MPPLTIYFFVLNVNLLGRNSIPSWELSFLTTRVEKRNPIPKWELDSIFMATG